MLVHCSVWYLKAVADHGSFTRAATALHVRAECHLHCGVYGAAENGRIGCSLPRQICSTFAQS
jgi:hypothetical protein